MLKSVSNVSKSLLAFKLFVGLCNVTEFVVVVAAVKFYNDSGGSKKNIVSRSSLKSTEKLLELFRQRGKLNTSGCGCLQHSNTLSEHKDGR